MTVAADLREKLGRLTDMIKSQSSVAVAFSGGVDSTFLLKYAHDILREKVMAVTAAAPNFSPDETAAAINFCASEGIRHLLIDLGDAFLASFASNPVDRCYICKKSIFGSLLAHPALKGAALFDGTNSDDTSDYRPGEKALFELGIKSPLREAGLTKDDIRAVLKDMGLSIWSKPAFACLASSVPYGEEITVQKLKSI
jgi:uncharacterized protein